MRTFIAAGWRSAVLAGLAIVTAFVTVLVLIPLVPGIGLGIVVLVPWPIGQSRRFVNAVRRIVARWCNLDVGEPYNTAPQPPQPRPDGLFEQDGGLFKRAWWPAMSARIGWVLGDRATAKDLLWLVLHPVIGT
ncbi:MAG TPA: sensor domain-containing protein, partial [Micromonosporaceae bacterium]